MDALLKRQHSLVISLALREVLEPNCHFNFSCLLILLVLREASHRLLLGPAGWYLMAHNDIDCCLSEDLSVALRPSKNLGKLNNIPLWDGEGGGHFLFRDVLLRPRIVQQVIS